MDRRPLSCQAETALRMLLRGSSRYVDGRFMKTALRVPADDLGAAR